MNDRDSLAIEDKDNLLPQLLRAVLAELVKQMGADAPSAEALSQSRRFLAASGVGIETAADQRKAREVYRLFVKALHGALQDPSKCSASLLAVTQHFLADQGVRKALDVREIGEALTRLEGDSLPFKVPAGLQ